MRALSERSVASVIAILVLSACGDQAPSPSTAASASSSVAPSAAPSSSAEASPSPEGPSAFAGAWTDGTAGSIGETAEWTNRVELADLDGDGDVDILFANGGDYDVPGNPVANRVFLNAGDGTFTDAASSVLGEFVGLTRVIKVADLNADGNDDIVLGTTYNTQSQLLIGSGGGAFSNVTATNLPAAELSAGDLEIGDVDGDEDLDIAIVDWGDDGPLGEGGPVVLWLNDGAAVFTDATADRMPDTLFKFSWDIELVDVDNDWDLDAAISCKLCVGSSLFMNDGTGTFTDVTEEQMPAFTNNYEFAPIDLDADGYLDLVTTNDGNPTQFGFTEHVLRNDGTGAFEDMTADWWGRDDNPGWDDNGAVALDVESDGDADFLLGSLDGPDRLLINDGSGVLTLADDVFDGEQSGGTLEMALADLNGDGLLDVVEGQGEVPGHEAERVWFGTDVLAPDTAPPLVQVAVVESSVLARVHDNRTPYRPHDWQSITARWDGGEAPMTWYGESLFRAGIPADAAGVEVCAVDAAGNETCRSAS